jgi:hypothetical protein
MSGIEGFPCCTCTIVRSVCVVFCEEGDHALPPELVLSMQVRVVICLLVVLSKTASAVCACVLALMLAERCMRVCRFVLAVLHLLQGGGPCATTGISSQHADEAVHLSTGGICLLSLLQKCSMRRIRCAGHDACLAHSSLHT